MMDVRSATLEDVGEAARLMRAVDTARGRAEGIEDHMLRDFWDARLDLAQDAWLVHDDGQLAGLAWLLHTGGGPANQFGCVHPQCRNRGVGSWLLDLSERRSIAARARALRVEVDAEDSSAEELCRRRGYRPVRRFYSMGIALDGPERAPVWPDGIHVSPFRREHARVFYDVGAEAFADEWGFVHMPYDEWLERRVDGGDTSLWFLAWDGDEAVGLVRCDPEYRGAGLVRMIGVRPGWRGRGLGEALLLHAFAAFRARGIRRVTLGVDAENATGATRLYERVGMRVESESVAYEKELERA